MRTHVGQAEHSKPSRESKEDFTLPSVTTATQNVFSEATKPTLLLSGEKVSVIKQIKTTPRSHEDVVCSVKQHAQEKHDTEVPMNLLTTHVARNRKKVSTARHDSETAARVHRGSRTVFQTFTFSEEEREERERFNECPAAQCEPCLHGADFLRMLETASASLKHARSYWMTHHQHHKKTTCPA